MMILGAYGMLGFELQYVFPSAKFFGNELDITNKKKIFQAIKALNPDIVINAAAYANVDGCENDIKNAFQANGEALAYISEACHATGSKLIHYSTDYIFEGSKKEYKESDHPKPINIYGKSKLLGEKNIMVYLKDFLIIRTSWLYGRHGKNFVNTLLELSSQMDTVPVVDDQFGKPTYTVDLAKKTKEIIDIDPGIYHITNEGSCSWYEFARAIIPNAIPIKSKEFFREAKRPKYSILTNTKTDPMRHWKEALREYLNLLKN